MKMNLRVGKGVDTYIRKLENFADASDGMLRATIYPGAKVIADEIRNAIEELPEIDRTPRDKSSEPKVRRPDNRKQRQRNHGKKQKGVTRLEKEGLLEGLGIAKMRYNGSLLNTKIGMDGYNKHVTEKWPKGHPNVMIARSVENGTSFRQKTPFISTTARANKHRAERHMKAEFDKQAAKQWNQGG